MLSMIFACDEKGAIGKDGDLPWRQSSDLQHFKRTTLNKIVVMGRKTWDSLGQPLPKRRNIVMTRQGIWRSRHPSVNGKAVTRQDIEGEYDDYEREMKGRLKRKAKGRAGAASAARKKQKKERKC